MDDAVTAKNNGVRIDPAQKERILALCKAGLNRNQIAEAEGCKLARVAFVLNRAGVYTRKKTKRVVKAKLTDTPDPVDMPEPVVDALLSTGGRYADLAAYATAQGITHRQALQRWHRARLGLPMLGVS